MSAPTPKQERDRRYDAKRRQQNIARPLYKTKRWLTIRAQQLEQQPLCAYCLKGSPKRYTEANVCDHVNPHDGDPMKFWLGPFQSLCEHHHNSAKKGEESRGYSEDVGADGLPIDPRHPFNR